MNVSSFFQGSLLKFSLAGEGVSIDPGTGELVVAAEALARGITVDVTAEDASGTAGPSFRLTIAAEPAATEAVAPSVLTPPAITGTGRIGAALVVAPGAWGGVPAPEITLQWLRDGTEIEGATGESYVPQAADDGREITCRVTAGNAAGEIAAEPAAVRVTREPPVAVDLLADVDVLEGSDAVILEAAAAFAGEALRFAADGAGAAIDPTTGRLTLPTDAARDGETVTVTATNSGGSAEATFLATVRAKPPVPIVPVLLAAPVLAGTGKIGSEITLDDGSWSGLPLPVLSRQWLRDGAEIAGATGAAYLPGPEDDRCALACRVTALNTAGSRSAETPPLAITYVAPTRVQDLLEEILDQGVGPVAVETAGVFAGEALRFAANGAGVAIDPETGVLTVSTDAALSETVTVTATNSGGSAEASFQLTIEVDPAAGFPPPIADDAWSAREVRDLAPAGRRRIDIPDIGSEGFELCLYSGLVDGIDYTGWRRVMQPGEIYTTNSSMKVGSVCHNVLFWRRVADGAWAEASNAVVFEIAGLKPAGPKDPSENPAANQTLAAGTQAALKSALDARVASGSAAEWIIDLPAGDYGNINLDDYKLPGKTILRSQNYPSTGAKFRRIQMRRAKNIQFQFINLDRGGQGYTDRAIDVGGVDHCGFSYCDLNFDTTHTRDEWGNGWVKKTGWGIWMYRDDDTRTSPSNFTLHMNLLHGMADCAVYTANSDLCTFSENVFVDICGDDIQLGHTTNSLFLNNWGTRRKYPTWNPKTGWKHTDFIQTNSKTNDTPGNTYIGNVLMKGIWEGITGIPSQGLFGNGSMLSGHLFENNIILTNTPNAIMYVGQTEMYNNRLRNNTTLRLVDDFSFSSLKEAKVQCGGAIELSHNVQCGLSGSGTMGADGLNIVMKSDNYDASLVYYTSPRMGASFYDLQPVAGKPTHWSYEGDKLGAWARFQDVIVNGKYPKVGPAAAGWKASYDPQNQITA